MREERWQKMNYLTQASPQDHNSKAYNDIIPHYCSHKSRTVSSTESSLYLYFLSFVIFLAMSRSVVQNGNSLQVLQKPSVIKLNGDGSIPHKRGYIYFSKKAKYTWLNIIYI